MSTNTKNGCHTLSSSININLWVADYPQTYTSSCCSPFSETSFPSSTVTLSIYDITFTNKIDSTLCKIASVY
jgi:hypothetical protein